jgi:hypothetical protein
MTPGISTLVEQHDLPVAEYLCRHQSGDWGDLDHEDKQANDQALEEGTRIFSAYHFQPSADLRIELWVITEADRSSTTILLPEEY